MMRQKKVSEKGVPLAHDWATTAKPFGTSDVPPSAHVPFSPAATATASLSPQYRSNSPRVRRALLERDKLLQRVKLLDKEAAAAAAVDAAEEEDNEEKDNKRDYDIDTETEDGEDLYYENIDDDVYCDDVRDDGARSDCALKLYGHDFWKAWPMKLKRGMMGEQWLDC